MVAGMVQGSPSTIFLMVPRRIFPERVFGKRATVIETFDGDFIAPRLIGMVGQSFDHRAFDGAYSAAYLSKLKSIIETRDWVQELSSGRTS